MGLLSSVGRPPAGARRRAIRARRRGTPRRRAHGARADARARRSNRPPARVARGSGTFDRTRTCDDQRSWGEQGQEYATRGRRRRAGPGTTRAPQRRALRGPREERGSGGAITWLRAPVRSSLVPRCDAPGAVAQAVGSSTSMLRVRFGSTGMPGPMVVETVTFLRYRPLAEEGLARSTSSRAAA